MYEKKPFGWNEISESFQPLTLDADVNPAQMQYRLKDRDNVVAAMNAVDQYRGAGPEPRANEFASAIKNFQGKNDLMPDAIMLREGPTLARLNQLLQEKLPRPEAPARRVAAAPEPHDPMALGRNLKAALDEQERQGLPRVLSSQPRHVAFEPGQGWTTKPGFISTNQPPGTLPPPTARETADLTRAFRHIAEANAEKQANDQVAQQPRPQQRPPAQQPQLQRTAPRASTPRDAYEPRALVPGRRLGPGEVSAAEGRDRGNARQNWPWTIPYGDGSNFVDGRRTPRGIGLSEEFRRELARRESNNNPRARTGIALGLYQIQPDGLTAAGMHSRAGGRWNGPLAREFGIRNEQDFLNNVPAQEAALHEYFRSLQREATERGLLRFIGREIDGVQGRFTITLSGLMAAMHRQGGGTVHDYLSQLEANGMVSRTFAGTDPIDHPARDAREIRYASVETRLREFARVGYSNR